MVGVLKSVVVIDKHTNTAKNIAQADLIKTGMPLDVHCASGDRQLSILPYEKVKELDSDFTFGKYKENLTVSGLDFSSIKVGDKIIVGDARLEVVQVGTDKPCADPLRDKVHKLYIFAKVVVPGIITEGDEFKVE